MLDGYCAQNCSHEDQSVPGEINPDPGCVIKACESLETGRPGRVNPSPSTDTAREVSREASGRATVYRRFIHLEKSECLKDNLHTHANNRNVPKS